MSLFHNGVVVTSYQGSLVCNISLFALFTYVCVYGNAMLPSLQLFIVNCMYTIESSERSYGKSLEQHTERLIALSDYIITINSIFQLKFAITFYI